MGPVFFVLIRSTVRWIHRAEVGGSKSGLAGDVDLRRKRAITPRGKAALAVAVALKFL